MQNKNLIKYLAFSILLTPEISFSMNAKQKKILNKNKTKFLKAARLGQLYQLRKMINQKKIPVNTKNQDNFGALMLASTNNNLRCLKFLISKKADVNLKNQYQVTALMGAITAHSRIEIIKQLLKNGADVNSKDICGWSSFHLACLWGYNEAVIEMLKYNPDIKSLNNNQQTPLDSAITHSQFIAIEILLEQGADTIKLENLKNNKTYIVKNFKEKVFNNIYESNKSIPKELINLVTSYLA